MKWKEKAGKKKEGERERERERKKKIRIKGIHPQDWKRAIDLISVTNHHGVIRFQIRFMESQQLHMFRFEIRVIKGITSKLQDLGYNDDTMVYIRGSRLSNVGSPGT